MLNLTMNLRNYQSMQSMQLESNYGEKEPCEQGCS